MLLVAASMWAAASPSAPSTAVGAAEGATASPAPLRTAMPNLAPVAALDAERVGSWGDRRRGPTPPEELTGYRWPLEHARITNAFGVGRPGNELLDGQMMHDGVDISSFCGAHVTAAHDGLVLAASRHYEGFVGWVGDLGPYRTRLDDDHGWGRPAIAVVVDDGNGYRSIYLHLNLAIVRPGDTVKAGDMLGYEGSTGAATGCHLHYALFSPLESRTIDLDPKVAAETKLPALKVARINPLLVLPPIEDAFINWGWGAGGPN